MKYSKCIACGNRTALITVCVNIALAVLMGIAGTVGSSHALVAGGLFEAADVVISLIVLASLRFSEKGPDKDHPYGHGKVEFITGSVVAVAIIIALLFLFKYAVDELSTATVPRPELITLFIALVAIFISEQLSHLNNCAGKELKSPGLSANAVYNRFNAYTSALVAVGILGAMAGNKYFDPAVVIIIGVLMIKTLIEFLSKAYAGLMDSDFSPEFKMQILNIAKKIDGVDKILSIKARSMGRRFWVNLCIEVRPILTVSESFRISELIREEILFRVENVEDVQIETRSDDPTI